MSLFSFPTTISTTVEIEEITTLSKGTLIVGDGSGAPTTLAVGTNGQVLIADSTTASGLAWGGTAITGPGSSTDNAVTRWDGTTGTTLQNSVVTIGDTGAIDGVTTLDLSAGLTWDAGVAVTAAAYQIQRDNGTVNLLHYNVPTTSAHRWSINGVDRMDLNDTRLSVYEIGNMVSATNARIVVDSTGITIARNIADANICLIVDQVHASSTGDIAEFRAASSPVLSIDRGGGVIFDVDSTVIAGNHEVRRIAAGLNSNVATGDTHLLTINGVTEMSLSATAVNFQNNSITTTGGGSLTGTWSNLGSVTTVDINGGSIDGTAIGLAVASTAGFTALVATSLDLNGALDLDVAALGATITNTADAASSQVMILEGDRATMADGDEAFLSMGLSNDGGTQKEFARLTWVATDVNVGTGEDGRLDFAVMTAGSLADELQLDGAALAPSADGGLTLGTTTLGFSALYLSSSAATQIDILAEDQGAGNNTAGRPLLIAAGAAGSLTTGGAGGALFLEAGNAGGSGNNSGGNINLTPGNNTGSGQDGAVNINQPGGVAGTDAIGIAHNGTDAIFLNMDTGVIQFGIGAGNSHFTVGSTTSTIVHATAPTLTFSDTGDGDTASIRVQSETNLADITKVALADVNGLVIVINETEGTVGMFEFDTVNNAVVEISDVSTTYTTTEDNDTTVNVYWDAVNARFELNNERGAARTFKIFYLAA